MCVFEERPDHRQRAGIMFVYGQAQEQPSVLEAV